MKLTIRIFGAEVLNISTDDELPPIDAEAARRSLSGSPRNTETSAGSREVSHDDHHPRD